VRFKYLLIALFVIPLLLAFYIKENPKLYPSHFPEPYYNVDSLDYNKLQLGRALFYDPILSANNTISCNSCHSPYNAFSHTDHKLSHGIFDSIGRRNAPPLFNLAWQKDLMWDGAIKHIDKQPLAPIHDKIEMGSSIDSVLMRLQKSSIYPQLFVKAFGDSTINSKRFLKALSEFQLSLVSAKSKYDYVKSGLDTFTKQEQNGYSIFKANCNSCHVEPMFTNFSFASNGLPVDTKINDWGKYEVSNKSGDSLLFKVPTLRNLTYTYPYMHDGRFANLNEVLNYYTHGLNQSDYLSVQLKVGIDLTPNEIVDLKAFLLTLNDQEFVFNKENKFPRAILLNEASKPK